MLGPGQRIAHFEVLEKKIALYETGRIGATPPEMVREMLGWLDRYRGPVK